MSGAGAEAVNSYGAGSGGLTAGAGAGAAGVALRPATRAVGRRFWGWARLVMVRVERVEKSRAKLNTEPAGRCGRVQAAACRCVIAVQSTAGPGGEDREENAGELAPRLWHGAPAVQLGVRRRADRFGETCGGRWHCVPPTLPGVRQITHPTAKTVSPFRVFGRDDTGAQLDHEILAIFPAKTFIQRRILMAKNSHMLG